MNCYKCGEKLRDGYRFCSKCGAHQDIAKNKDLQQCQKCGEKIPDDDRFCGYCGFKLNNMKIVHGDTDYIKDSIGVNNLKNLKFKKLTEEEQYRLERARSSNRRREYYPPSHNRSNYDRNNLVQIGAILAVLIVAISLGVYFLGDIFFGEDFETSVPEDVELIGDIDTEDVGADLQVNNGLEEITEEKVLEKLIFDFNDAWIGYVNKDESTIFQYIVPGSDVESTILNFDKDGVTEAFLEINVKDVNILGNQGVLKVHEKIEKTVNGEVEVKVYDWIYVVEKVNDRWLIKNYTKDENPSGNL